MLNKLKKTIMKEVMGKLSEGAGQKPVSQPRQTASAPQKDKGVQFTQITAGALLNRVGDKHVEFGSYPQTKEGGVKKILWRILDNKDGQLLLLSEYVLAQQKWNSFENERKTPKTGNKEDILAAITQWEECELRAWLNGYFYNQAFHAAEKKIIVERVNTGNGAYILKKYADMKKITDDNQGGFREDVFQKYEERGCRDTRDKVFLLNIREVLDYFKQGIHHIPETVWWGSPDRTAKATDYTLWNGATGNKDGSFNLTLNPYSGETWSGKGKDAVMVKRGTEYTGAVSWWLRNLGANDITKVSPRASFHASQAAVIGWGTIAWGGTSNYVLNVGVRPAILINNVSQ